MKVADDRLRSLLGITDVTFKRGQQRLRDRGPAGCQS